jgi:CHASE2 domain-containing sensor protein
MSILTVAFCLAAYIGVMYWITIAIPVGTMSSYAAVIAGGFPPNVFAIVAATIIFAVICLNLLERINPEIARSMREANKREQEQRIKQYEQ